MKTQKFQPTHLHKHELQDQKNKEVQPNTQKRCIKTILNMKKYNLINHKLKKNGGKNPTTN